MNAVVPLILLAAGWQFALLRAEAQVLYSAEAGTLPAEQGWFYYSLPVAAVHQMSNHAAFLSTTATASLQAGLSPGTPPPLPRTNAFALLFTLWVHSEAHLNTNRAGCSVIVLGEDARGIELGFWTNRIFAQADAPLFTHAEDAEFNCAIGFMDYALTLRATNYMLFANGVPTLTGPIRDYTAFTGPLDPYETPNLIFLGDNTTSAHAAISLRRVALIIPPLLTAEGMDVVAWRGVSNVTYRVEASTNLVQWATAAAVTSRSDEFRHTNPPAAGGRFLRVAFP